MHPAPSLAEAPPKTDETRPGQHHPASPDSQSRQSQSASPPVRKDTTSSTSTSATSATVTTIASADTVGTTFSIESSPNFSSQPIFSVKDGTDVSANRRTNRRRTGPLSAPQREKAALIRKLGACTDCRRRRVACHPNHHNMSWEDAMRKYRSHSPTMQELAPLVGRPLSPAPLNVKSVFTQDPQEMDIDNSPTPQPGRLPLSETRALRTPLPSGPRLEKPASATMSLPGIDSLKSDLQSTVSRFLSDPHRSRYAAVQILLLYWQDEQDLEVIRAVEEFAAVLDRHYHYTFEINAIPPSSDGSKSSWRWLSRKITDLVDNPDQRDVLKVVYYNGHSYLDGNREMVLASSKDEESASTIRWSGIQQILEEACADTLIIMDAAYYPSAKMVRQKGVLEMIAASASEDHVQLLGRNSFTRALTEELQTRAMQRFMSPYSAAELHAKLVSGYPRIIQDRHPEKELVTSFPSPLHILLTGNTSLPSILLAPLNKGHMFGNDHSQNGPQLSLSFRLTDEALNMESWTEWLRVMPEGIKDLKVEGPYRNTLR